jgi:low affinity Fe/Cu permease
MANGSGRASEASDPFFVSLQNTQNRDSEAMHVKLDELISAIKQADNRTLDTEDMAEQDIEQHRDHYANLAHQEKEAQSPTASKGSSQ